ncbi:2621_t:CDS:2 [Paraglomus occultum]|uniref:2621_t:CDS:1 n=1 Tax=Paraglomus occultum TaxID=144539 RepID=A0A9N8W0H3_9GLOM|nr:2621_t:CDS:2 [Paraglomus occultum]
MNRPTQTTRFATDAPKTSSQQVVYATGNTTTTAASQQAYLARVEEEWNKRLDTEIDQLAASFHTIIKASGFTEFVRAPGADYDRQIEKDKYRNSLDGYVAELKAANIAKNCEALLSLTHELKTAFLLNDTETLMQYSQRRKKELTARKEKIKRKVLELNDELAEAIWEMESVLGGGKGEVL